MADLTELERRDNELAAQIDDLDNQIKALKEKQRELAREDSKIRSEYKVERKLAGMSNEEQVALAQAIEARGIKSDEGVGTPGL